MVVLSIRERMQSTQARLSQAPSALAGFDAIQQNDREVACPDCTVLCAMSLAHQRTPEVLRHRGLNAAAGRDAGKGPYISKAARNADFAAATNVQLRAGWQQWAESNEANRHAAICHAIVTTLSRGPERAP